MTDKKHKKIIFAFIPLALFLYFILWPGNVAHAARIWQSGFETSDTGVNTTEFDNDLFGTFTFDTTVVRTGTRALKAAANNSTTEIGGTSFLGISGTEVYVGFGFYMAANPGPQTIMLYLYDANQLTLLRIQVQASTGKLMLINRTSGTDVTVGTMTNALSTGVWHYIELHLLKDATAGVAQMRVDGALVIDGQGLNTSGRGTPTLISFANDSSASGTTTDFYWDDAVVNDTSGSLNNSWPGNSKIVTLVPGSDTATIKWTAQNAGTHFSEVADLPAAVDITTYIKTTNGVVGLEDRWNMTHTPAGIGSCDTINAIAVGVRGGSTATTLSPAAKIQLRDASGNTADATAQTYNLNGWKTTYPALIKQQTWEVTPAAMTKTYLDGMIAAVLVTTQANQEMRITAVWVTVDYTTASCPSTPSTITQQDYQWFNNVDSVQPGSSLANQNTSTTLTSTSTIVRLRTNVNVSGINLATSSQAFKLQYSTATSSGWADINNPANVQNVATAVSAGTVSDATGRPTQNHLIYAVNDAAWWLFYVDSGATTTLKTMRSTDLVTWTAKGTETLTRSHKNTGVDLAVAYANISNTDVVHIQFSYPVGAYNGETYHSRATISGGTITFTNTEAINNNSTNSTDANYLIDAPNLIYDSNNKVVVLSGFMEGTSGYENINFSRSTNADLGSSWTAGFPVSTRVYIGTAYQRSHAMASLGSANYLGVAADANMSFTNLLWTKYTDSTASYSAMANVRGSALVTAQDQNDWGMSRISNTDTRLIMRSGSNTYEGFKFDGTSWTTMTAPGTQTSKPGGGMFLATDGTDFYLFIIDSDASNTIRYNKFTVSAGTWGGWTALVTTTQTRSYLSGYQNVSKGTVGLIWSQTNGSNYDIVSGAFPIAWKFYDNPSVATSTAITSTLLASSTAKETYEEQNPTAVNPTAIPVGGLGEWDFPLNPYNATGTTYYFRFIKSDGSTLDSYTRYSQIGISNGVPGAPGTPTYASVSTSTLVVNWTSASGANYYKIERGTNGNTFSQISTTTSLLYNDYGLATSTTYYYRLRGNGSGGDGPYGASSSVTTGGGYVSSASLVSIIIDTAITNGVTPNSLSFQGTTPANTQVKFQFAGSNATSGPWSYVAWNSATNSCDSSSYYVPSGPNINMEIKAQCHNNQRYLRYKIFLSTTDSTITPIVTKVTLNYAK